MAAKYQYTLTNDVSGSIVLIDEPLNWESLSLSFKRSKLFQGVTKSFSQDLVFWGEGNDFIREVYNREGVNSQVDVEVKIFNLDTYLYETLFTGRVNFSNYSEELTEEGLSIVSTNIESSLFEQQIINGSKIKVNLDKLEDRFGDAITPFTNFEEVKPSLSGQEISGFYEGSVENESPHSFYSTDDFIGAVGGGVSKSFYHSPPIIEDINTALNITTQPTYIGLAVPEPFWEIKKTGVATINFSLELSVFVYLNTGTLLDPNNRFIVNLISDDFGVLYEDTQFLTITSAKKIEVTNTFSAEVTRNFNTGDKIRLYVQQVLITDGSTYTFAIFNSTIDSFSLSIETSSLFQRTLPRGMFVYEMFSRIVNFLTGESDRVIGDVISRTNQDFNPAIENGSASRMMVSNGLGLRGFPDEESPLVTSLASLYESVNYGFNIGIGFVDNGGVETVLIDDISKFYTETVIMTITESIKTPKMSSKTDGYWSSLDFGFNKYKVEDRNFQNTQEFNTRRDYNSAVQIIDSSKKIISPYIGTGYGIEYQRTKQYFPPISNQRPDQSRFDDDLFFLALTNNTQLEYISTAVSNELSEYKDFLYFGVSGLVNNYAWSNRYYEENFTVTGNDILYNNGEPGYTQTSANIQTYTNALQTVVLMGGQMNIPADDIDYDVTVTVTGTIEFFTGTGGGTTVFNLYVNTPSLGSRSIVDTDTWSVGTTFAVSLSDAKTVLTTDPDRYYTVEIIKNMPSSPSTAWFKFYAEAFKFELTLSDQLQEYRQENTKDYFGSGVVVSNLVNSDSALNFRISPRQAIERHKNILGAVNYKLSPDQITFSGDPIGNTLVATTNPSWEENSDITTSQGSLFVNEVMELDVPWTLTETKLVDANRYGTIIIDTQDVQFEGYIEEIQHRVEDNEATLTLLRKGSFTPSDFEVPSPTLNTVLPNVGSETTELKLDWTSGSASEEDGFKVFRSDDGLVFIEVGDVGTNVLTYTDTGLSPAVSYYYRVAAYVGAVNSSYSNVIQGTTESIILYAHDFRSGLGNYTINAVYASNVTIVGLGLQVNAPIIDTILTSTDSVPGTLTGDYKMLVTTATQNSNSLVTLTISGGGHIFNVDLPKENSTTTYSTNTLTLSADTVNNLQVDILTSTTDSIIIQKIEFVEA